MYRTNIDIRLKIQKPIKITNRQLLFQSPL